MQVEEIQALLASHIPGCEAQIHIEGSHVYVTVVSDRFEDLGPVKRHQLVYGVFTDALAAGRIHAVHIKPFTPAEWQQQHQS